MTYTTWAQKHPQAAAELAELFEPEASPGEAFGKSEAWAQQRDRLTIAHAGGAAWRNNVGATPTKCPQCQTKIRYSCCGFAPSPMRFGLCNDSHKLNAKLKSSDIIGINPVLITQAHVGATIGQFMSIEEKRPGWVFNPNDKHEEAQAAWLTLVARLGGFATFSTGELRL